MRRGDAADGAALARTNLLRALGVIRTGVHALERRRPLAEQATPERVYLVGFMASGKSTVGPLLARRLRYPFVDLDHLAEERAGLEIPTIFQRFGEGYFRRLEFEVLRDLARAPGRAVVALGGGTFVSEVNRRLVARSGISVWLDVPFPVLARRLVSQGRRPLAASPDQLRRLHATRLPFYHEADVRIRAGDAPADAVVRAIVRTVREDWPVVVERRRLLL
jgi:shikimate kinase